MWHNLPKGGDIEEQKVTIKFDGQSHQVDLITFTNVLLNYLTVVRAAASQVGVEKAVKVSIAATEPGSLDAIISVAADGIGTIFDFIGNHENGISAAVLVAGGLYGFKQKIAGKKSIVKESEDKASNIVNLNVDGKAMVVNGDVYALYENHPETTAAIDRSFSILCDNPEVSAVSMKTDNDVIFSADRDEFSGIATSPNYEGPDIRHVITEATLLVTKPYLAASKTRKWEFIYNGEKITACIHDESFLKRLGQFSFSVGTRMAVKLDVTQELSERYSAYLNKSYAIAQVLRVEPAPKDEPIF